MPYWIIQVLLKGKPNGHQRTIYATPFQAQTVADRLMDRRSPFTLDYSYEVRPASWQEREEAMFYDGVYTPPVWSDEAFWVDAPELRQAHFTHISLVDPTSIAFTEDDRKGDADRQTPMRPGKYLQKFLGAGPSGMIEHGPYKGQEARITKMKVAFYAAWHQAGKRPPNDDVLEFTNCPDRMVDAYEEGPESCMMGKGWSREYHPVRVYAGGGLELALLLCSTSSEVIGRALCWPEREVFGRVYPTPNSSTDRERYDELMARLKALGWTSIEEDGDIFNGAKLRRLESRHGHWLMPYLDHEYGVCRSGEWWIMDNSEHHQSNTDGTYDSGEPDYEYSCDYCDDGLHEDDTCTVYTGWHRNPRPGNPFGGYPTGDRTYCDNCRGNHTFYCDGSDEHYVDDVDVIESNQQTYAGPWFWANGGYECSWSEENFLPDDEPPITLSNGAIVASCYLDEASFVCLWDGQRWPRDFESEAVPGYAVNCDVVDVHPVEMEHVLPEPPDEETTLAMALSPPPPWGFDPTCCSLLDPIVAEVYGLTVPVNVTIPATSIHTPRRDMLDAIHATLA